MAAAELSPRARQLLEVLARLAALGSAEYTPSPQPGSEFLLGLVRVMVGEPGDRATFERLARLGLARRQGRDVYAFRITEAGRALL